MSLIKTGQVPIGSISATAHYLNQEKWVKTQLKDPSKIYETLDSMTLDTFKHLQNLMHRNRPGRIRELLLRHGMEANEEFVKSLK